MSGGERGVVGDRDGADERAFCRASDPLFTTRSETVAVSSHGLEIRLFERFSGL